MSCRPRAMDQATASGRSIERGSFAQVDAEAGDRSGYSEGQWAIVRRLIHATADFDLNGLTCFHPQAVTAGLQAFQAGAPLWVDVEMIRAGLSAERLAHLGITPHCHMADLEARKRAERQGTTRSEQAVALAAETGVLDGAVAVVGNAPTALRGLLSRIEEGAIQPRLLIAMPVGFVDAAASKEAAMAQSVVPWLAVSGRKGGSPAAVAAVHSLLGLAEEASG